MSNKCIESVDDSLRILSGSKKWYTTREAAEVLGSSGQFVRNLIAQEQLPAKWVQCLGEKRFYKIHRNDLILYLAEKSEEGSMGSRERLMSVITERMHMTEIKGIHEHLGKYIQLNS